MQETKKIRTVLDPTPDGVIEDGRDLSKDPTILKRAEEAREFIKKYGLPKSYYEAKK